MDSSKRTATAPMPENTPMDELVVDEVVEGDKLKIFVDLYFWFSGHLIELYVLIAECLGFRETPLEGDKKRVRWTCVKTFRNIMFSFEQRLIQLRRFAVAICTMTFIRVFAWRCRNFTTASGQFRPEICPIHTQYRSICSLWL